MENLISNPDITYNIQINLTPEEFEGKDGKLSYFWVILKCKIEDNGEITKSNAGFGWADTVEEAFKDANSYFHYLERTGEMDNI